MSADQVRLPGPGLDLDALFLFEAKRRVQRDRTVSLNGTLFEVDAALVGQIVTLRYDPALPASRGVEIWHEGTFRRTRHAAGCLCQLLRAPQPPDPEPRSRHRTSRPAQQPDSPCASCAANKQTRR